MEQTKYKLEYTDDFVNDLVGIARYITSDLSNPVASNNLLDIIDESITNRLKYPIGFRKYVSKNNPEEVYYKIYVKNFIVFYVVMKNVMECRRIIYRRRDLDNLI